MTTIRDARKAAGLSQQGVTDALGIPRRTLQDWESGKRTPPGWAEALVVEKLEKIAQDNQAARRRRKSSVLLANIFCFFL